MTEQELIKIYNPANSASLTPEQVAGLQKLTSEQIKVLAKTYPNVSHGAYLLIVDGSKPAGKQMPTISSFQNLWNLRERNGMRRFVAMNFKGNYKPRPQTSIKVKRSEVLDLSDTELLTLPGFKTKDHVEPPAQVEVTKVKKKTVDGTVKITPMSEALNAIDEALPTKKPAKITVNKNKPA